MRALKFGQKAARSGKARSIVVFLHGYGADGADLLGLAEPLALHMPDTLFLAPDAPEQCSGYPVGRQWFPIPRLDGSSKLTRRSVWTPPPKTCTPSLTRDLMTPN